MSYFCHACSASVTASLNESSEPQCPECSGSALEAMGQGLDAFLAPAAEEPPDRPDLIHQIIGRVLSMDVQVGPQARSSLLDVLQSVLSERGAPVGIIIRQPASSRQLDSLSTLLDRVRPLDDEGFEDILHRLLQSENAHRGAPPAPEDLIADIPRTRVGADTDLAALGSSCGISHEPFERGDLVLQLACGHAFGEEAITCWLRLHNTCPICRLELVKS